jgi:pentatricopeptide repeat protein
MIMIARQVSYTTAMDAAASNGKYEVVRGLLDEMVQLGIQPNHRSFNAVMSAYGRAGLANEAIDVLGVGP